MSSTLPRNDDIVIQRRFHEEATTHLVQQVYAVTYPGQTEEGTENTTYDEAERLALTLSEAQSLSVWYEESPYRAKTLVKSFRAM